MARLKAHPNWRRRHHEFSEDHLRFERLMERAHKLDQREQEEETASPQWEDDERRWRKGQKHYKGIGGLNMGENRWWMKGD